MTQSRNTTVRKSESIARTLLILTLCLAACGQEESAPPPAAVAKAAPPPPPPQAVEEPISEVIARLGIDPRIKMDESERPKTPDPSGDGLRLEATLKFFDAMVKGNAEALKPMLSDDDQTTLASMQKDGQWKRVNADVTRVVVGCTNGQEPDTFLALGVFTVGDRFEAQLWSIQSPMGGEQNKFVAMASPTDVMEQLKGTKAEPRVQQWLKILKDLADKSKQPDVVVDLPQQDRSVQGETPAAAPAPPPPATP